MEITSVTTLVGGTDYKAAQDKAVTLTFAAISGLTVGSCTAKLGLKGVSTPFTTATITGTVSDIGSGNWKASFDIDDTTLSALEEMQYDWSVEVIATGVKINVGYNATRQQAIRVIQTRST